VSTPEHNEAHWFAAHLQPHEPMLRAWLRRRFPQIGPVDDIVQEAYTRVLQAHERESLDNPKAYLFAAARYLALDHFRRRQAFEAKFLTETEARGVLDESEGIPEALAHHEDLELLTQAIQSLPDRCRQVFTLRKIYDLSQKEIAAELGLSEHTVEAQVAIGIKKCTAFLQRQREG